MAKPKRFSFTESQNPQRVARVQNLRRSSAAGPQDHTPRRQRSRSAARTAAIKGSY